jgi:hypothetical protein
MGTTHGDSAAQPSAEMPRMLALGHALDFRTWRSLAEGQGLDHEKASLLMIGIMQGIARSYSE